MIEQQIRCRSVLTGTGWLQNALIQLDSDGNIRSVEKLPENARVDYGHIVPGMPNLHSHAFQRQMAGLTGLPGPTGDSFWSWREYMYGLALRIQPDQLHAIAAFLQVEMLENGYTSCAEFHYLHHQANGQPYDDPVELSGQIVAAAELSGIALTLLPVLYSRSGFDSEGVSDRQRRFYNSTEQYLQLWQGCAGILQKQNLHRVGLALHSLRAVAPQQISDVLNACSSVQQPIHIHIAEQPQEVEDCKQVLGARPVEWLLDQHAVDQNWCLVHATHMSPTEAASALHSNAVIGLCPSTEADLGDGYFDIADWFKKSGSFGIGSDSNLRLAVNEELRMLEFQARLHSGKRNVLVENGNSCGRSLFQRALVGGAQALGQKAGRVAPGYRADLVELNPEHLLLAGRCGDTLLDSWILAGDQTMIRSVWVAGEQQVVEGRHRNREALQAAFKTAMLDLL